MCSNDGIEAESNLLIGICKWWTGPSRSLCSGVKSLFYGDSSSRKRALTREQPFWYNFPRKSTQTTLGLLVWELWQLVKLLATKGFRAAENASISRLAFVLVIIKLENDDSRISNLILFFLGSEYSRAIDFRLNLNELLICGLKANSESTLCLEYPPCVLGGFCGRAMNNFLTCWSDFVWSVLSLYSTIYVFICKYSDSIHC